MDKVHVKESDGVSVKELDDNRFEITLGEEQFKTLSQHAEKTKMTLEEYIISLLTDYAEMLDQKLNEE